ncbi:MAG: tRNA preQ1(34) S-adenosylmethionine ribosyltransferase-isomerase QueA [bacterium]
MKLSEFDYHLPKKYIAQQPAESRDCSKLMVLDRATGKIEHKHFYDIGEYLKKGDILVVNNSKVMAARLFGRKSTGARVEVLLLNASSVVETGHALSLQRRWQALVKPAKRLRAGDEVIIDESCGGKELNNQKRDGLGKIISNQNLQNGRIKMKILKELEEGIRLVEFNRNILEHLDSIGSVPLPPYIKADNAQIFKKRYQTVYSKSIGSAAAPTAGLHFTSKLIKKLKNKGIIFEEATLHIGLDTFRPMTAENIEDHKIHNEYCELREYGASALNKARERGNRIIAVGTTATRVLESACDAKGKFGAFSGWTDKFIYPGYEFKSIDALITNFHLPKSSLLLMVSAFCGDEKYGKKFIFRAYNEAKKKGYRFFSFGDVMLIL